MKEAGRLQPENTMRLLPYAERNELPLEKIYDVIARHVSTKNLTSFATEIGKEKDSVYIDALIKKCCFHEDVAKRANATIHHLLKKCVNSSTSNPTSASKGNRPVTSSSSDSAKYVRHEALGVQGFTKARKCENCLEAYKNSFIEQYAYPRSTSVHGRENITLAKSQSVDFINLLQITDDIATSLKI